MTARGYESKVRPEKVEAVREIADMLQKSSVVLLTEYRGLTVQELAELRRSLAQLETSYRVVKNTLARLAARDTGIEGVEDLLEGPTALAYCIGDPVSAAKAIATFARDHPALVVKGGLLEGRLLSADDASGLATVDPVEVSLAKICGLLTAALGQIAGGLEAPLSQILFVLERVAASNN